MSAATSSGRPLVSQRVGDEERHKAAELLANHHAHGRLSQEEFEDRLGSALTAQTTAELGRLLADLPLRADDGVELVGRTRSERPVRRWARSRAVRGTTAVVGVVSIVFVLAAIAMVRSYSDEVALISVLVSGLFGGVAGGALGWVFRNWRAHPAREE